MNHKTRNRHKPPRGSSPLISAKADELKRAMDEVLKGTNFKYSLLLFDPDPDGCILNLYNGTEEEMNPLMERLTPPEPPINISNYSKGY